MRCPLLQTAGALLRERLAEALLFLGVGESPALDWRELARYVVLSRREPGSHSERAWQRLHHLQLSLGESTGLTPLLPERTQQRHQRVLSVLSHSHSHRESRGLTRRALGRGTALSWREPSSCLERVCSAEALPSLGENPALARRDLGRGAFICSALSQRAWSFLGESASQRSSSWDSTPASHSTVIYSPSRHCPSKPSRGTVMHGPLSESALGRRVALQRRHHVRSSFAEGAWGPQSESGQHRRRRV